MPPTIPPFSLTRQAEQLGPAVAEAVGRVLASGRYAQGPECAALEQELAPWFGPGVRALTCSSGTDALHLALRAAGVGSGDKVLTTPFTFFATAGAILLAGARPVFADIDPETFNLDPARVAEALQRERVAAILPVHLYGRVADMTAINRLAAAHGVPVVEDAAQAIGAREPIGGGAAGALGACAAFSFYPTKNLGAMGEGGLVTTSDAAMEDRLRLLRAHGSRQRYEHETLGWNGRMHELQAAILRAKLPRLEGWNRRRREIAAIYHERLGGKPAPGHVYHQFVIRSPRRDALRQWLAGQGIGTEVYYPKPLHRQPALAACGPFPPLPEAERAAAEVVALPMFPELTDAEAHQVADAVANFA